MERVICLKCGSIGYTASPEQVNCSDCGGRHKVLRAKYQEVKNHRKIKMLSLIGLAKG